MAKLYTDDDIKLLKDLYEQKVKPDEIAKIMDRTKRSIISKASSLGLKQRDVTYSDEEINYIIDNYDTKNVSEIAQDLGRGDNYHNICRKAREMGLTDKSRKKIRHKNRPKPKKKGRYIDGVFTYRKYDSLEDSKKARIQGLIKWHKENEHPRGMLGKTHTKEYRKELSRRLKSFWEDENSYFNSEEHRRKASERMSKTMNERVKKGKNIYSRARGGTREDLGFYVRSRWEANVARYLIFLEKNKEIYKWEYEPDTFWFHNIKRGTRSYTPDFKIWETKESEPYYWEVKGYMDQKSKTRMKRMAKYYPDVRIDLIMKDEYKEISKWKKMIDNWETDKY